jgi:hypothetical protein
MGIGDSAGLKAVEKINLETIPLAKQSASELIDKIHKLAELLLSGVKIVITVETGKK